MPGGFELPVGRQLIHNIQLDMFRPGTWMYLRHLLFYVLDGDGKATDGTRLVAGVIGGRACCRAWLYHGGLSCSLFCGKSGVLVSVLTTVSKKRKGERRMALRFSTGVWSSPMQVTGLSWDGV